ncbi:uncharacterized protein BKA55DRAFT_544702 [Fusarium redolens]|uniref:Uncharacterized protein n=1 Tax=Fusarium redolens TaxID=48865 RepID=A0A9P9G4G5_FUSRE|nr:uncharacterized protein BKA55DRAFT_544702 [Fusarium redolens]KAH7232368.1 hypothetical protein BKA55DRAFT_544702 [Fusarium redolens]
MRTIRRGSIHYNYFEFRKCVTCLWLPFNAFWDRLERHNPFPVSLVREAETNLLEDLGSIRAIIAQQERGLNRQAIQPRPSKATLLVNPGDRDLNFPLLDSRYRMVEQVEPVRRSFSWTFIAMFSATPAARTFWIRHSNANDCPAQERCHHWRHLDGGDWFTPEENAVDLKLACLVPTYSKCMMTRYKKGKG